MLGLGLYIRIRNIHFLSIVNITSEYLFVEYIQS